MQKSRVGVSEEHVYIRSFFKPKDGLLDPKGSLSSTLPSKVIALANKEVENVVELPLAYQYFSSSCLPYFFIYMVAMNTANSFTFLHANVPRAR